MCYTIYLYHFFIISAVGRVFLRWLYRAEGSMGLNLISFAVVAIPVVLAGSAVLFVLAERPFMKKEWYLPLARGAAGWWRGKRPALTL